MRRTWRIIKSRFAAHAFDSEGSRLHGSRWTSHGVSVAYTSESLALAILEILAGLQAVRPLAAYVVFTADIPEELIDDLEDDALPPNWREYPAPPETQAIGNAWVRSSDLPVLRVPSVVASGEHNYLINPAHPAFAKIQLAGPSPLDLDPRLFGG